MTRTDDAFFEVLPWELDGSRVLFRYRSSVGDFTEVLTFPSDVTITDEGHTIIDLLCLAAAVSYAKVLAPTTIHAPTISLTDASNRMVAALFDNGMREFAFHNGLPIEKTFMLGEHRRSSTTDAPRRTINREARLVIPIGAGRDSSVVASALQHMRPLLLSVGENRYADKIATRLGLPLVTVSRQIDPLLLDLNAHGALNGHIPVTAITSLIALLYADITQSDAVVMANEYSASEPTRHVDGVEVNHQYSKSQHFETLLRDALTSHGLTIDYFSALRDRRDIEIARIFSVRCEDLHTSFMSCNQAMLRDPNRRSDGWCCTCAKCRSVFLTMAPYSDPQHLTDIFGVDMLNQADQLDGFRELIDVSKKPFECVGEIISARESLVQLQTQPQWKNHHVVQHLRDEVLTLSTQRVDTPGADAERHFIPDVIHRAIVEFFSV